jgi:phosphate transport system permease protein
MKKYRVMNGLIYFVSKMSVIFVICIFFGMFYFLIKNSLPSIHTFGFKFLFNNDWNPVLQSFGAIGAIKGTLITSFIALSLAVPVSFGITVFILKIAPTSIQKTLRISIDLLAGVPSIIYGMWGLYAFSPLVGHYIQPWLMRNFGDFPWIGHWFLGEPYGIGLFNAGIILGIMIIPFITSIMHDVFELVPDILLESVLSIGSTTWESIWHIILPYGRIGFVGGVMLGLGRALGETMAVSFVIGNAHTMTTVLFAPANSMTSSIANEFTEATHQLYNSALVELGLILFIITGVVVFLSNMLLKITKNQHGSLS